MTEEWRPVEGWPYEVSSEGNVRRSAAPRLYGGGQGKMGKLKKCAQDDRGYLCVGLHDGERHTRVRVQYLVAAAFLPARTSEALVLDHINRDKLDNRVTNLRWVSPRDNNLNSEHAERASARRHKPRATAKRRWREKLSAEVVEEIRARYQTEGLTRAALAAEYGVCRSTIGNAIHGRRYGSAPEASSK